MIKDFKKERLTVDAHIRLSPELMKRIEMFGKKRDWKPAQAMRRLIVSGLMRYKEIR